MTPRNLITLDDKIALRADRYRVDADTYLHDLKQDDGEVGEHPRRQFVEDIKALDTLPRLWASSTGLLIRFKAKPTVQQAVKRMMSEVKEFVEETDKTPFGDVEAIAKEGADVWVTVINAMRAAGVSREVFCAALETVMKGNDDKDFSTHCLNAQTQGVERIGRDTTISASDSERLRRLQAAEMHGDGA